MSKETKKFVSNSVRNIDKSPVSSNKTSTSMFVAKVSTVSVNRRITISSNFSVAKSKK